MRSRRYPGLKVSPRPWRGRKCDGSENLGADGRRIEYIPPEEADRREQLFDQTVRREEVLLRRYVLNHSGGQTVALGEMAAVDQLREGAVYFQFLDLTHLFSPWRDANGGQGNTAHLCPACGKGPLVGRCLGM